MIVAQAGAAECDLDHGEAGYRSRRLKRVRIDNLLSQRGIFPSRSRAAASVIAGDVLVLPGRRRVEKPGELVPEDVELEVAAQPQFVSRGGIKLANALDRLGLDVAGRRALDVGASTGGFTDCLLQRGAAAVTAVDVAYGELDWRLRSEKRVTVIERKNARFLSPQELPYRPDLIVIDVSFISLAKVLPAVLDCAAQRYDCLALVKPQFEAGRRQVGKGGVVRDPAVRRRTLVEVGQVAQDLGTAVRGYASSGLPGPKGNRETFIWLAEPGRGGITDLEPAAAEADA
jgi:23S rRNA (cytidine1920-2'-O)/16S rRNA (cytidine1409-2'-O)-methyltransferase